MSKIAIIGGGPIGVYLSTLLIHSSHEIHLIESGNYTIQSEYLDQSSYDFLNPTKMPSNVHRLFGGANYWKSRIGEFLESDFKGNDTGRWNSWFIEKEEIEEGYRNSLNFLGSDLSADVELESDIKKTVSEFSEFSDLSVRIHKFARAKVWENSLESLLTNPQFVLRLNTFCNEILPAPNPDEVTLSLISEGEQKHENFNIVVLTAGTFQSTALLLKSKKLNIPGDEILGGGLMDHIEGVVGHIAVYTDRGKSFFKKLALNKDNCFSGKKYGGGIYLNNFGITYHLEVLALQEPFVPFGTTKTLTRARKLLRKARIYFEKVFLKADHYSLNIKSEEFMFENSKIWYDNVSKKLVVDHRISNCTLQNIRTELRKIAHFLEHRNLCKCFFDKIVFKHLKTSRLNPNWHPMGTTRLGISDSSSVVNTNLCLHKHNNIFVASASVFPTGSNSNPTFTTMALTYRLSRHILKTWSN